MPSLLAHTPESLLAALTALGENIPLRSCRIAIAEIVAAGKTGLVARDGLSKANIAVIERYFEWTRPIVEQRHVDPVDRSVRYLFRLADGEAVEAVRIPLFAPGRFSVCLSSQVGCAMGCIFCATGRLGLSRHLEPGEIIGTFLQVRDEIEGPQAPGAEPAQRHVTPDANVRRRVSGVVFMGQGEPLHNYDAVMSAASVLSNPAGGRIDAKSITISTVGLVPQIRRYTEEKRPWKLVISLSSAVIETRRKLLPVAGKYTLDELSAAVRDYAKIAPGRVTLAYVVMGGVNTGPEEATELARWFADVPLRINLIDVNDAREGGFVRAPDIERAAFMDSLQSLKVPIVRRYSVGQSQNSACGMLAAVARAADEAGTAPAEGT